MSVSSRPTALAPTFAHERPEDGALVQALIDRAFGPGRFAKAAERLREGSRPDLGLSLVAWADGQAVGCVRMWPIWIGARPALLLGPFAVEDVWRSRGLGGELIARACRGADAAGHELIVLVGDESYFAKFDFHPASPGQVMLPGPADPKRLLWRGLKAGSEPPSGLARPRT